MNEPGSALYGIMHVTLLELQEDGNGRIYSFRDEADPDNVWGIAESEFSDILIEEPEKGTRAAVFFQGNVMSEDEEVRFLCMVPDDRYSLKKISGVTTSNVMLSLTVRTASGEEIEFIKDNCRIEDGAINGDSGDAVTVYYAEGSSGANYPLKIYKNEKRR